MEGKVVLFYNNELKIEISHRVGCHHAATNTGTVPRSREGIVKFASHKRAESRKHRAESNDC